MKIEPIVSIDSTPRSVMRLADTNIWENYACVAAAHKTTTSQTVTSLAVQAPTVLGDLC